MPSTVIITGAGQGLGRAYALAFAREGYHVCVADIAAAQARAVASEISASGGSAFALEVDVSSEASCAAMAGDAVARTGRIDVVINNAAIFSTIKLRPFWEIDVDEWDRVMAVNVRGTWLVMKAVAPVMQQGGGGSIINVSSAVVPGGRPNYLHYVASKAAVIGMTRSAARELGPFNIRVNALMPGATTTEVPRETFTGERATMLMATQSLKRTASVDDFTGVALFLASEASSYMSGQTLNVDGGNVFL